MKYRTDFVTNSSSSSFAAAAVTTLAGILASCNCRDAEDVEDQDKENAGDDGIFMQKAVMPEGMDKLVAGGEPVYLYAQLCATTEEGYTVLADPTAAMSFQASKGAGWFTIGNVEIAGDWAAVEVVGVTPEEAKAPPTSVTVKASCRYEKKKYSVNFKLAYEAEPALEIKPMKCDFLSGSGGSAEFDVKVKNPGPEPWLLSPEPDTWVDKICTWSLEDVAEKGDKAKLKVTESDNEETSGGSTDHYTKARIVVNGSNGTKDISDYCDIYLWREGLFRSESPDLDRETGDIIIKADKNEKGEMKISTFDLRYMRWEDQSKSLKCDTAVFESEEFWFSDPDPQDEKAEALFETTSAAFKYEGVRPSNMPSGKFSVRVDRVIPGKRGERFRFNVIATVDNGVDYYDVTIPFAILPAYMAESGADWQKEYDYCKKIINDFFPESKKAAKLAELEECKHYMGASDLKQYRHETWDVAYDIMIKKHNDYMDEASWYDWAMYTAEWVQWLNDRAFSVVTGTLTGPIGTIVITQCKELIQDLIAKYVLVKATDTWMSILYDLLYNRFNSVLGATIDNNYFSNPERSKKWIAMFFMYKWAYHWAFDFEGNERKGCLEGLRSACADLAGVGLEEKMKPFIKDMADRGNFSQNMDIDDYVQKTLEKLKPYIDGFMNSDFIKDERGSV